MTDSTGDAIATLEHERKAALERQAALVRRVKSSAATLRLMLEVLEGHARFEAVEDNRFRVSTGALVEGKYPSFAELKSLFADLAFVERELAELNERRRALEAAKTSAPDQPRWPPTT